MPSTTRADTRLGRVLQATLPVVVQVAAVAFAPSPASAGAFVGEVVARYSNYDTFVLMPQPDGTSRRERQTRSFWSQDYRAGLNRALGSEASLFAELRYSDVSFVGGSQHTTIPYGMARLTSARYGLTASYRPTRQETRQAVLAADDSGGVGVRDLVTRDAHLLLSAYVAPPRLPRLEGQWTERHRFEDALSPGGTGVQRSLRAVQDFGSLVLQGGYADQLRRFQGSSQALRRNWDAGANYSTLIRGRNPANLAYAFTRTEAPSSVGLPDAETHHLTGSATWRASDRASIDGGGFYRLANLHDGRRTTIQDFDAYAFHHLRLGTGWSSRAGGGMRTQRDASGVRDAPYVLAALTGERAVAHRWSLRAGLGHATNWVGDVGSSTESFNLGTTLDVSRTLVLSLDTQTGAKAGPLGAGVARYATNSSGNARLVPLRSVAIMLSGNVQTYGGGWLRASARARAGAVNLTWRPFRPASFTVVRSVAGAFPNDQPRLVTTAITGGLQLGNVTRIDANYSKLSGSAAAPLPGPGGSDTYGFRLTSRVSRRMNGAVGYQQADRGGSAESRSFTATVSYRLGL